MTVRVGSELAKLEANPIPTGPASVVGSAVGRVVGRVVGSVVG